MKTTILRTLAVSIIACGAGQSLAAWDRQAIDVGGIPGQNIAISSATSRAYIPLLAQRAISVFDGVNSSRLELDIKPTAVAYSGATGRLFIVGMFDNAVIARDEASGAQTRIAVGTYPDRILVDDVRGKVYVSNWGGITGQGGISIVDTLTLAVRTVPLGGYATNMVLDAVTGQVFITAEGGMGASGSLISIDASGNIAARVGGLGYQAYSLAVDSRTGLVYVAGLSNSPTAGEVNRVFRIFSGTGLQLVSQQVWPSGGDWYKLNFLVDPAAPGLYLSSNGSPYLLRLDANGGNLQAWPLGLGETLIEGRTFVNGVDALDADPVTGHIFLSSPIGSRIGEFNPATGATDVVGIPGAVGFGGVRFWGSDRVLVLDAAGDSQLTVLRRAD